MEVTEGDVTLSVPELATNGTGDGIFYNPRQERNRDITVATLRAFADRRGEPGDYLDATTASGARGVRAANAGWSVTCCDRNPEAVELARENLAANDLDGEVFREDARTVLYERDFDVVDIDPFGSPIGFIDPAFARPHGLICVTATDTAPLCGAHFRAGIRRYGAVPRNTEYHREMGLRVLLSAICRTAARYDVAIQPLLSHTEGHYVRTYLGTEEGATVADEAVDELGTVWHCQQCLYRKAKHGLQHTKLDRCPNCDGEHVVMAGPLWLGPTHDVPFIEEVHAHVDDAMGEAGAARDILETIAGELDRPTHYDQHVLFKKWNRSATPMDDFLTRLERADYTTSRAHYGGTAFKTDAPVGAIRAITEP